MHCIVLRRGLTVLGLALAASALAPSLPSPGFGGAALAQQGNEPAPKQIKLTQAIVDHLAAAQKQIRGVAGNQQDQAPDPKVEAKIAGIVKANGFASMGEYSDASYSVGIVLSGMDPENGNYIGAEAALKKQIAEVKADKKMPAKEKKEALDELNGALQSAASEKPLPGNVDVVKANAAKLNEGMQGGD